MPIYLSVHDISQGNERSEICYVGRAWLKEEVIIFGQDPGHILDTKKSLISKGPAFNVFSKTFQIGFLVDITPNAMSEFSWI